MWHMYFSKEAEFDMLYENYLILWVVSWNSMFHMWNRILEPDKMIIAIILFRQIAKS